MSARSLGLDVFSTPRRSAARVVNFYNWSNYIAPGVLEAFTKETGIEVVYDTFDANETLETRLLAGKSGYESWRHGILPTASDRRGILSEIGQVEAAESRPTLGRK